MICTIFMQAATKVMQAATNDLHESYADSYEEFVCYLYRLLRMICTKVMQIAMKNFV
jgi:hypothetical protein